jgi:hypothetical protein
MDMNTGTDKLLNTPIPLTFKAGEGTIEVAFHEMTLMERSTYRRTLEARARNTWLGRLKEIANASYERPEEKRKFLADAAQREPDLEADITKSVLTEDGILLALQTAGVPALSKTDFDLLNAMVENAPNITKALNTIFGIVEAAESDVSQVAAPEGAAPVNPPAAQSAGS